MRKKLILIILACLILAHLPTWSDGLSAGEILLKVDQTMNAPLDQEMTAKLILIDKNGNQKTRTIHVFQKGFDKRLARFTAPADQKGIAVLTIPDGLIYVYLPAYKKVKRIASHVKNNKFAGTDFSYSDMEAKRYSEHYEATLVQTEQDYYLLELTPIDPKSVYSKQLMRVRRDNFVPFVVEYYNKKGILQKKLSSTRIEKIGDYWTAREQEMVDVLKEHSTIMMVEDIRFDQGLSDDLFTQRNLAR